MCKWPNACDDTEDTEGIEKTRSRRRLANHDPSLWAAIDGQGGRVFHQLELQYVDEEADGGVVVPHHECDEFKM
jgi:hypothetical protein